MAWYPTTDVTPSYKDAFLKTNFQELLPLGDDSCNDIVVWGQESSVKVLAEYTPLEWQKLLDCILQGAIIIYPNDYHAIWWSFVKQLDCPMSICQEFIECIENDASVRDAINNAVTGNAYVNGSAYNWGQDILPPVADCNKDATWGYVSAMWDYINQKNKDFLQQLAEAGNLYDQLDEMFSAIPMFETLPIDELIGWIGDLGDYNLEAYNASITVEVNTQIKCDLFCLAVDNNCTLTFEMVWEYMLEKFGGANFPTLGATFAELVLFMATGVYLNDRIVYLWTLVQLGVAFIGAEFLGAQQMRKYALYAQIGNPDSDWSILCTDCGWLWESDFPASDETWTPTLSTTYATPEAQYVALSGWLEIDDQRYPSQWQRVDSIEKAIAPTYISSIGFIYDITRGVWVGTSTAMLVKVFLTGGGSLATVISSDDIVNGVGKISTLVVNDTVDKVQVLIKTSVDALQSGLTGSCKVVQVKIIGTGTNPF